MYSYEIDLAQNLVVVSARGDVNLQSSQEFLTAVLGDARFGPTLDFLVDVRDMTTSPSASDLRQFADLLGQAKTPRRRFGIVAAPGVQYGMGRMIATLAGLRDVRMSVFDDEANARAWLQTRDCSSS